MTDPAQNHSDQIAYWNGAGAVPWVERQERTDRMLAEVAEAAIARADPASGESVVDVGCGTGATSLEIARRVGLTGQVTALDVSAPLMAKAAERLSGCPWAKIVVADASTYRLPPASADLLFSRFGVMFFGDPDKAFANMRAWMKPTGRVLFACWRKFAENPWGMVPLEATYAHLPRMPKLEPEDPGPFSFASEDRVSRILTNGGFARPEFEPVDFAFDIAGGEGLEGAVAQALAVGPTARALGGHPQSMRDTVAMSVRAALAPYVVGNEVRLKAAIWLVRTRPAG